MSVRKQKGIPDLAIGIDLGGTNMRAGLVSRRGKVLVRGTRATEAHRGGAAVLRTMLGLLGEVWEKAGRRQGRVAGVGLGTPGMVDQATGRVTGTAENLRGWRGTQVIAPLGKIVSRPAFGLNDVTAHALGEAVYGAGRGSRLTVCFALGTGIGGGIVLDGRALFGVGGFAGELGHQTVDLDGARCNCGSRGCVEYYSSATGVVRMARRQAGIRRSSLCKMAGGDLERLTARMVFDAARLGDPVADAVVDRAARYLGAAVANTVNTLNPDVVIIGGGVARAGDVLMRPLRKHFRSYVLPLSARGVRIVRAKLGDDAGLMGAAEYVFQQLDSQSAGQGRRKR